MWLFPKKSKSKKYLLVIDIGTEFVKALIFRLEKGISEQGEIKDQGAVIGFGRQRQLPNSMLAGAVADIDGVTQSCRKAIEQANQMARVKPKKVIIGIAGEFIKGLTSNFVCPRENPEEPIDSAELQNIIQRVQWKAFDQARGQIANETCCSEVEIKPINALLTDIKIDGYKITNPLGFQGKEIFLGIFNVYAPLVHLRAIENIAAKLDLDLLSIAAESYALTKTSCFNPTSGAIFIDIGGGTTDIALVRQNRVEGIKSFALAGQTFTKRLSKMLDIDFAEAEKLKIRHSQNSLSQSVQWRIRDALKNDLRLWLNGIELVLEDLEQAEYFPPVILLCGGGSLLPGIKNILKREKIQNRWMEKFPFSQPPQIDFIQAKEINNIIDKTDSLEGPEYITPMALASLALEIVTDEDKVLPPVLRRVLKIMR